MDHCCEMMSEFLKDIRINLFYDDIFREYYTKLRGGALQCYFYCPWCGRVLPRSVRGVWHGMIWEMLGEDFDVEDGHIPDQLNKPAWWLDLDEDIEILIDKYEREL